MNQRIVPWLVLAASLVPIAALGEDAPIPKKADPPFLRKWFTDGASFRLGTFVAQGEREIDYELGETQQTSEVLVVMAAGGSVTSWLEIGGQMHQSYQRYDIDGNAEYFSMSVTSISVAPVLRPYLRYGRVRLWGALGYAIGFTDATLTVRDDGDPNTPLAAPPTMVQGNVGPIYGAGIDVGIVGRRGSFVLTAGYEMGSGRFDLDTREGGRVEGSALPDARAVLGLGFAL